MRNTSTEDLDICPMTTYSVNHAAGITRLRSHQMTTLQEVARICTGYQMRRRLHSESDGSHRLIRISDLDTAGRLDPAHLIRFTPQGHVDQHQVQAGDLLHLSRGPRLLTTVITEDAAGAVASGCFFILRLIRVDLEPAYLAWYMRQETFLSRLRAVSKGSRVRLVAKTDLELLQVEVPPPAVQQKILAVNRLQEREEQLATLLLARRSALVQARCLEMVRASMRTGGT
jgi:hypothetical protein